MTLLPIFAHGSGLDDVLWFVGPLVVAFVFMKRAERAARRRREEAAASDEGSEAATRAGPTD